MCQTVCTYDYPYVLRGAHLILDINQVVSEHPLSEDDYDSETGNAICIPCNPTFNIPQPHMIPPTDLDRCDTCLAHPSDSPNLMTPQLCFLARRFAFAISGESHASCASQIATMVLRLPKR